MSFSGKGCIFLIKKGRVNRSKKGSVLRELFDGS